MHRRVPALVLLTLAFMLAQAAVMAAPITFATFSSGSTAIASIARNAGTTAIDVSGVTVDFNYAGLVYPASYTGPRNDEHVTATLTLHASSDEDVAETGLLIPGFQGTFAFIYGGQQLLGGTFTAATFSVGTSDASSGDFTANTVGLNVITSGLYFTSDYVSVNSYTRSFDLNLGGFGPLTNGLDDLSGTAMSATLGGSFNQTPVPEPAMLALIGSALIGLTVLARKRGLFGQVRG